MRTSVTIAAAVLGLALAIAAIARPHAAPALAGAVTSDAAPSLDTSQPLAAHIDIDCDIAQAGVQSSCDYILGGQTIYVDVAFTNDTSDTLGIGSFGFRLRNEDGARLVPFASSGTNANGNPDANDALSGQGAIYCSLGPTADTHEAAPPVTLSSLGCTVGSPSIQMTPGSITQLARVRYEVPADAQPGSIPLSLTAGPFYGSADFATFYCPGFSSLELVSCSGATINLIAAPGDATATPTWTATPPATATPTITPTPTSAASSTIDLPPPDHATNYVALDCDTSVPGIQQECHYPLGTQTFDIGIVWVNRSQDIRGFSAVGSLVTTSGGLLRPRPPVDANLNSNPDFNEAAVLGTFLCTPRAVSVENPPGSGDYRSSLTCNTGQPHAPWVESGTQLMYGVVHYEAGLPAEGVESFTLDNVSLYDDSFSEIGSCAPSISIPMPCFSTTIVIGNPPPTVTPTATRTAAPSPTPTITPVATATNTPSAATTPVRTTTRVATTTAVATTAVHTPTAVPTATATPPGLSDAVPTATPASDLAGKCDEAKHGRGWIARAIRSASCHVRHKRSHEQHLPRWRW